MSLISIIKMLLGAEVAPADIATLILKYGPAISALIHFIELEEDEKKRACAMDEITRGLQAASETGDTTLLEAALKAHISNRGVRVS
jgi:hypothetical protein